MFLRASHSDVSGTQAVLCLKSSSMSPAGICCLVTLAFRVRWRKFGYGIDQIGTNNGLRSLSD